MELIALIALLVVVGVPVLGMLGAIVHVVVGHRFGFRLCETLVIWPAVIVAALLGVGAGLVDRVLDRIARRRLP